jgi:hypothetical protein
MFVRFEVSTAVTMKKAVFWDVAPCRNCVNRRFGGKYRLHLQGRKQEPARAGATDTSVAPALAGSLADFFLSSTLKMEAILSSETSVNTISKRRHIQEDGFLHSHRRENLKSYK